MHFVTLVSLFFSASLAYASPTLVDKRAPKPLCSPEGIQNPSKVVAAFQSSGIVPTLIPSISPKVNVTVKYPSMYVNLGNEFTTAETVPQPTYNITAQVGYPVQTTTYSFFMIDPDVPEPSSPVRETYLHWYVSGNKASCITNQSPDTVTTYESPSPGSAGGGEEHRYTFLAYREPPGYTPDVATAQTRPGFDVNTYAANGGLVLVGGNFFLEDVTNTS